VLCFNGIVQEGINKQGEFKLIFEDRQGVSVIKGIYSRKNLKQNLDTMFLTVLDIFI